MGRRTLCVLLLLGGLGAPSTQAEDGYQLWLRYVPIADASLRQRYLEQIRALHVEPTSPTLAIVRQELTRGLAGLLDAAIPAVERVDTDGVLLAGTPRSCPTVSELGLEDGLRPLGREGFLIRTVRIGGRRVTVVAGNTDVGVLYGAFHLLRLLQTHQPIDSLDVREAPRVRLRLLNHWDNLDRTVERGYAGFSLWDWFRLPDYIDPRYLDYARACASLGINGAVLTNVNADARVLLPEFLRKVAALADVLRPYGIRVYLTARFSAPMEIGGLSTADPLDPAVRAWWREKAAQIYRLIPDFGGFLVKANSEGQPGPQNYGRTHADGANMLADALAPYGGVVMWRAFVYAPTAVDRVKEAYDEFVPLDGSFRPNVLIQVKNGPLDFQPREPFHPLFGAMPHTPLMIELQITKEYLGFSTHLAYLGTLWEEVLQSDTYARGEGSTVARVIDGSLFGHELTGIAGVANVGTDRNWCGSIFDQANWYAFGRLAWNPYLSAEEIAEEWIRMTFTNDARFVEPAKRMMLESREAVVDYMTPLGLAHLMGPGHHYGPAPWFDQAPRPDWNNTYYHRADTLGIGFDRTPRGSNAVSQYFSPLREIFGDLQRCPEKFLLWFHHVPWDHRMRSGRPLWEELVDHYYRGVQAVRHWRELWDGLRSFVDPERHQQVAAFLRIQEKEAVWWRDACVLYFQTFSRRPIPEGYEPPVHSLDSCIELQERLQRFPMPGHWVR